MSMEYETPVLETAPPAAARREEPGARGGAGLSFGDLITPVTPEGFWADYWEQKPLVSRAPRAELFASLFSLKDVDRAISYYRPTPGRIDLVSEHGFVRDNYLNPDGTASVKLVRELYLKGSTVILNGLHQTWEPLALFSSMLEARLSHPVAVSVYLTPPDFKGVSPHFDTQDNFLLQVEGYKRWKVYPPVQELPRVDGSYTLVARERLGEAVCETVLEPGDVLYVPRGFVHEGVAGDRPSLHITVDVLVRTWLDFLADALSSVADRDPRFRRALPTGFLDDAAALRDLEVEFAEFVELFRQGVKLKDALWKHTEALAVKKPPVPDGHFAALHAEIGGDTRLRRRRTTVTRVVDDDEIAGVQFSGNTVLGPAKIVEALRFIAANEIITPDSLPGPLNSKEKLALARRLLRAGLLTLA
jgi:lysine-specific demethylase/histidyl-hydroxylase NO66